MPTPPMYMPGRFRTGSRPSRTVMSFAVYEGIQILGSAGFYGVLQGSTGFCSGFYVGSAPIVARVSVSRRTNCPWNMSLR